MPRLRVLSVTSISRYSKMSVLVSTRTSPWGIVSSIITLKPFDTAMAVISSEVVIVRSSTGPLAGLLMMHEVSASSANDSVIVLIVCWFYYLFLLLLSRSRSYAAAIVSRATLHTPCAELLARVEVVGYGELCCESIPWLHDGHDAAEAILCDAYCLW